MAMAEEMMDEEFYALFLAKLEEFERKLDNGNQKLDETNQKLEEMSARLCSRAELQASPSASPTSSPPRDAARVVPITTSELSPEAPTRCSTAGPNQDVRVPVPVDSSSTSPTASPTSSPPGDASLVVPITTMELRSMALARCSTSGLNQTAWLPVVAATSSAPPSSSLTPTLPQEVVLTIPGVTNEHHSATPTTCSMFGRNVDVLKPVAASSAASVASLDDAMKKTNESMLDLSFINSVSVPTVSIALSNLSIDPCCTNKIFGVMPLSLFLPPATCGTTWSLHNAFKLRPISWPPFSQIRDGELLKHPWPPPIHVEILDSGAEMRPTPWPSFKFSQQDVSWNSGWVKFYLGERRKHARYKQPLGNKEIIQISCQIQVLHYSKLLLQWQQISAKDEQTSIMTVSETHLEMDIKHTANLNESIQPIQMQGDDFGNWGQFQMWFALYVLEILISYKFFANYNQCRKTYKLLCTATKLEQHHWNLHEQLTYEGRALLNELLIWNLPDWYSNQVEFSWQPVLSLLPHTVDEVQRSILLDPGGLVSNFEATALAWDASCSKATILISRVVSRCQNSERKTVCFLNDMKEQTFQQKGEARVYMFEFGKYKYYHKLLAGVSNDGGLTFNIKELRLTCHIGDGASLVNNTTLMKNAVHSNGIILSAVEASVCKMVQLRGVLDRSFKLYLEDDGLEVFIHDIQVPWDPGDS